MGDMVGKRLICGLRAMGSSKPGAYWLSIVL